jgi:hypothetical protein
MACVSIQFSIDRSGFGVQQILRPDLGPGSVRDFV